MMHGQKNIKLLESSHPLTEMSLMNILLV